MTAIGFFGLVIFTMLAHVFVDRVSSYMKPIEWAILAGFISSALLFASGISLWLWKVAP